MRSDNIMSAETRRYNGLNNRWQGIAFLSLVPGLLFMLIVGGPRLHDWWVDTILILIVVFCVGCMIRAFHFMRLALRSYKVDKQRARELSGPA